MAAATRGVSTDGELGVRYGTDTFIEGYTLAVDVIQHAINRLPLLIRILRHEPDGERILKELNDLLWLHFDPDQLPAWSLPPARSQEKRRYYGDR